MPHPGGCQNLGFDIHLCLGRYLFRVPGFKNSASVKDSMDMTLLIVEGIGELECYSTI
jgi:hypothetical protein